jgi:hypothetical protein
MLKYLKYRYIIILLAVSIFSIYSTLILNISDNITFYTSISTIYHYLEAYSSQHWYLRIMNYPTYSLNEYHPGPNPYFYVIEFSNFINQKFGYNPIMIFNIVFIIILIISIIITITYLYKKKLYKLSIAVGSTILLLPFIKNDNKNYLTITNHNLDTGVTHLPLFTLLVYFFIYTYLVNVEKRTLIPLLALGIMAQQHYSTFYISIMITTIIIIKSIKEKKLKKNDLYLSMITWWPLLIRFITDPGYIIRPILKIDTNNNILNKTFFENDNKIGTHTYISQFKDYLFQFTPISYFVENCNKKTFTPCISEDKVSIAIAITSLAILILSIFLLIKKQCIIFITLVITITYFILLSIRTNEETQSNWFTGFILAITITLLAKSKKITIILAIIAIAYSNINLKDIKFYDENRFIYASDNIDIIKNKKYKFNICELSDQKNCKNFYNKKINNITTFARNTNYINNAVFELVKNKTDICYFPQEIKLTAFINMKCSDKQLKENDRYELLYIPNSNTVTKNIYKNHINIFEFIDYTTLQCRPRYRNIKINCNYQNSTESRIDYDKSVSIYVSKDAFTEDEINKINHNKIENDLRIQIMKAGYDKTFWEFYEK